MHVPFRNGKKTLVSTCYMLYNVVDCADSAYRKQ